MSQAELSSYQQYLESDQIQIDESPQREQKMIVIPQEVETHQKSKHKPLKKGNYNNE